MRNGDTGELRLAQLVSNGALSPSIYEDSIKNFVTLAKEHHFEPLIVMMPAAYTVYARSIVFEDPSVAPIMRRYSDLQREWLAQNVERLGAKYFDATTYMQKAAETRLLYFPSNVHLTPDGHRALAEAVAPQLKRLLPEPK